MAGKIHIGPNGGRYKIVKGKKVYLTGKADKVTGTGAYKAKRRGKARRGKVVHGTGSFWSDLKDWSSSSLKPFERGISAIGSAIAGDSGASVGSKVGKWLGKITGLGDYEVKQNSLMGMITGGTSAGAVPRVQNLGGRTIVNFREYICDINSSEDFENLAFEVNPGLRRTFPWLCDFAANYQQWRPLGIIFCFESHSSDALNSTNTALGSLIFSTNYEAGAPDFTNQQEALNTEFTTSTKPSLSVMHPIECSPAENPQRIFYVRTGPLSATDNSDLWYDLCKTQIITLGSQAIANVGKLYISYEIEFLKPVSNGSSSGRNLQTAHYQISGVANATPLGTTQTEVQNSIGITVDGTGITFPPNQPGALWKVDVNWYGAGTAACGLGGEPAPVASPDISTANIFEGNTAPFVPSVGTTTASQFITSLGVSNGPVGVGGVMGWATSGNTFPTGAVTGDIFVTRLHPAAGPDMTHSFKDTTETVTDPYEKKLRDFLADKKNRHLSDEAKILLFDKLESKAEDSESDEEHSKPGKIERKKKQKTRRSKTRRAKSTDPPEVKEDYVDLTASQLIAAAVNKVAKNK